MTKDEIQKNSEHWYNKYKDAEKRNTVLEKENRLLGDRCNQLLKDKGELTDELAKWKEEWQEQVQKANNEGWERTQQTLQLTKAKEIIRTFLNMPMPNNEEVFADVGIFLTKAEQFLKEIEKCQSQKQH